jgi:hypothetical protein
MTGTLNTLMVTVPAAIVVAAVYEHVPGGAGAVFAAADAADARYVSVLRPDAAAGFAGVWAANRHRRRSDVLAESMDDQGP